MKRREKCRLSVLVVIILLGVATYGTAATIEFFSPQGDVKSVRQVTARFSEPMVSFGSPEIQDPLDVSCPASGKGRWADGKNWVYDFDKDLKAGLQCRFALKRGVKTLKGNEIKGKKSFSFSTGGPKVTAIYPEEGSEEVSEDQIFAVSLNGEATEESILRHVSCLMEETREHVGIRLLKGKEREPVMKALNEMYWSRREGKVGDIYLLQCKRPFPNNTSIRFVWGKGVASPSGVTSVKDQSFAFKTRSPFTARFRCSRERPNGDCIPLLPVSLTFSAPVSKKAAERITLKAKDKVYRPTIKQEEEEGFVRAVAFKGPFAENGSYTLQVPAALKDDAGRTLSNARMFPLAVKTGPYPPLAKFSARFGILEKADPILPVTVRSIGPVIQGKVLDVAEEGGEAERPTRNAVPSSAEGKKDRISENVTGRIHRVSTDGEVMEWLRKVASVGRSRSLFAGLEGADPQNLSFPRPGGNQATEVVGIPLQKTGLHIVELKSEILGSALLGAKKPLFVPTAALVTNLSAHFKWGRESSLLWVTTLDRAEPVPDASVAIRDCNGRNLWQGTTDSRGIAYVGKTLPSPADLPECKMTPDEDAHYDSTQTRALAAMQTGLFVFARKADDMTFVHTSWDDGIEPYRFKLPEEASSTAPLIAHTIFDRTLLRAGETIHMKHVIRKRTSSGIAVPSGNLPDMVRIQHALQEEKYELPLHWNLKKGTSETKWTIPRGAKLGHYDVYLVRERKEGKEPKGRRSPDTYFRSGEFRVEEFRVPLMKATLKPPVEPLINAPEMNLDIFVEYLSGGGAKNLPVKLRSRVQPKFLFFEDYETFTIGNGAVKEGIEKRGRSEEMESEYEGDEETLGSRRPAAPQGALPTLGFSLGEGGMARAPIKGIPSSKSPQDLLTELEFRDPNGEMQTVSRTTPVWPSSVLTGVETEAFGEGSLKIKLLALDLAGKPISGTIIKADLLSMNYYSHRKRLVGGFYSYENVKEVKRIGPACEGVTDGQGVVRCEVKSPVSGSVVVQATTLDPSGNGSTAHDTVWVPGREEWWFDQGSSDRIDLIPDKKRYEPGETASFQVRMPMRDATVLVTVEREGVLDARVERVTGKNPVIKLPVKGSYAPNIFVSALCVRGRVGDPKPTALVDLGRPSYKLGIAGILVGWQAHELKVTITPEKKVYRVRDKALVKIKVATVTGKPLPKGGEVAIAAVDEGLLELMPNKSWNLLEKMMEKRGYGVWTSTAQTQVVGKRHFGLKAMPGGGGGGRQLTRELFNTLLLWQGSVPLDEKGEASVVVPLSDALTGFAVVAVATCGEGLFGTGRTRIQTSQELILTSGLPAVVREGDRFRAGFLIRNTTEAAIDAEIRARIDKGKDKTDLPLLTEHIGPGEAREVGWETTVPLSVDQLKWEVSAMAKGSDTADSLKVSQKVVPHVPVQVVQSTLTQIEGKAVLDVEQPKGAVAGRGGIKAVLKPRLTDDVTGITDYMGRYPYTCMEQQMSRAVALDDKAMWQGIAARLPSHLDNDGLVKYFPGQLQGSDVLTSYILALAHEAGWEVPSGAASRMEEGLKKFVEGGLRRPQPLPTADLTIRKIAAVEALSRRGKAEAKLLDSINIDPNLWPTSAVLDWVNILTRAKGLHDKEKRLKAAEQIVRSRLNFQGTSLGFSTEQTDNLWWLMTGGDVNSVRAVLTFLGNPLWREDLPRIMRGALGRQRAGRWGTTVANAWGRLALTKFGKAFEGEPISGRTRGSLAKETEILKWDVQSGGGTLSFAWPKGRGSLTLSHEGGGRPWATIRSMAAVPRKTAFSSGYGIKKTITPVERKSQGKWSVGDVVRVRVEGDAQSDMTWVVVSDPIPAGATILGTGLGRDSSILTTGEKQRGWTWPIHEERSFEAFRAYYDYVPKGKWFIEYTMRLNNEGAFLVPPTRIEALYAPEMFGEIPNGLFEIK